ncbi:MAG: hypothetical protein Q4P65_01275 [Eubacteriales bacterium]|nr:hypothetical protein [Eubacteriales bacterium]
MWTIFKILILILLVNLLYLGARWLSEKISPAEKRGESPLISEEEMKQNLIDPEESNRLDHASCNSLCGGCTLEDFCPMVSERED